MMHRQFEEELARIKAGVPAVAGPVERSLDEAHRALLECDREPAESVIRRDDELDRPDLQTFQELLTFVMEDPRTITRAVDLIFVARFAERIADRATDICQEVVYLVEGGPIRRMRWERGDGGAGEQGRGGEGGGVGVRWRGLGGDGKGGAGGGCGLCRDGAAGRERAGGGV